MQIIPLLGFYMRRGSQIEVLIDKGAQPGNSHLVLDIVAAVEPLLKKYYPALNDKGLLDDVISTLKEVLAPPAPVLSDEYKPVEGA